jgi:hypothetical protein
VRYIPPLVGNVSATCRPIYDKVRLFFGGLLLTRSLMSLLHQHKRARQKKSKKIGRDTRQHDNPRQERFVVVVKCVVGVVTLV